MLALTDASLARLVRAAQQISHDKRHRWLQETARRLEREPENRRLRKYRERVAAGHRIYRLDLDAVSIEAMLVWWI
jgi:hypothetical protein